MSEPLLQLSGETLRAMLRHFAWERTAAAEGQYELWTLGDAERASSIELVVPTNPDRGDYTALLRRASMQLAQLHGQAAQHFVAELEVRQAGILDSTRWKKETAVPPGLIAWGEGRALYEAAQLQLVAAAKTAREPRSYHGNSSSYVARRFLEQSFMGQTAVGSFVITALTPAQTRIHLTKASEESTPGDPRRVETVSGRSILDTYAAALEAVRSGLDEFARSPRDEVFTERVSAGVSHELVKALAAFTATSESAVQIEVESLGSVPGRSVEFDFTPPESGILTRASTALAQDPQPRFATLVGEVTLLRRDNEQSERVIRLDVVGGAPVRKVRVRLTPEQYEVALKAHHDEQYIQLSGSLEREGKLYWLYGARNLVVSDRSRRDAPARGRMEKVDTPLEFDDE